MRTLEELFEHQLKDLFSAENQLITALPKMVDKAKDESLKQAFKDHLEETKEQKNRLQDISETLGISPSGENCKAMEGLIKEAEDFMDEASEQDVLNAGMIAYAQRIEHYEISSYGTAVRYAKELGHDEIARELQTTLDEEYNADNKLDKLAENRLNQKAV